MGCTTAIRFPAEARDTRISVLHVIQTGSGTHQVSYPTDTDSSLGIMRQGREADHSLSISAEVKKTCIYTSIPPYVFLALALVKAVMNLRAP
jgi:hypothetical protein